MQVTINGQLETLEVDTSVAALMTRHDLQPRHVAVEINGVLIPRAEFDGTQLQEGDQIEIVTLVGGG